MATPTKNLLKLTGGWLMLWEVVKVVGLALIIVIVVKHFLFQPFYVKGASMEPNYQDHEYLIIDELSYRFHEPHRGDVVVFHYPADETQYFIKRVIGFPGEHVAVHDGHVWINDTQLDESAYLASDVATIGTTDLTVPAGSFFLMGDNRPASLDSRIFGPVARKEIVGRTWVRAWPLSRMTHFTTPSYPTTTALVPNLLTYAS